MRPPFKSIHRGADMLPTDKRPTTSTAGAREETPGRACATSLLSPPWLSEQTYVTMSRCRKQLNVDWLTERANSREIVNILANQVIWRKSQDSHRMWRRIHTSRSEYVSSGVLAMTLDKVNRFWLERPLKVESHAEIIVRPLSHTHKPNLT